MAPASLYLSLDCRTYNSPTDTIKMKKLIVVPMLIGLAACQPQTTEQPKDVTATQPTAQSKLVYPVTQTGHITDTYFDKQIADPYRWLEDDRSEQTAEWVKQQNALTFSYLKKIPFRDKITTTLKDLINYEKVTAPFVEGDYTYIYKNDGLQNQYVVYRQKRRTGIGGLYRS